MIKTIHRVIVDEAIEVEAATSAQGGGIVAVAVVDEVGFCFFATHFQQRKTRKPTKERDLHLFVLFVWFVVCFCSFVGRRFNPGNPACFYRSHTNPSTKGNNASTKRALSKDCGNFLREK
jgi:hypothetical protein